MNTMPDAERNNDGERPESDYSRPTKRDPRGMRTGYTTGTTAAAAAKAAVMLMLSGKAPDEVSVPLPGGRGPATLKVHRSWPMEPAEGVRCSAIKDGGRRPRRHPRRRNRRRCMETARRQQGAANHRRPRRGHCNPTRHRD